MSTLKATATTSNVHYLSNPITPDYLLPSLAQPVGGPLLARPGSDARCDFDKLQADQRTAWEWAIANHIAPLTCAFDRNGAYLVLPPSPRLYAIFGKECNWWHQSTNNGLRTQLWLGCIGHIRVFWREVTCVH